MWITNRRANSPIKHNRLYSTMCDSIPFTGWGDWQIYHNAWNTSVRLLLQFFKAKVWYAYRVCVHSTYSHLVWTMWIAWMYVFSIYSQFIKPYWLWWFDIIFYWYLYFFAFRFPFWYVFDVPSFYLYIETDK